MVVGSGKRLDGSFVRRRAGVARRVHDVMIESVELREGEKGENSCPWKHISAPFSKMAEWSAMKLSEIIAPPPPPPASPPPMLRFACVSRAQALRQMVKARQSGGQSAWCLLATPPKSAGHA